MPPSVLTGARRTTVASVLQLEIFQRARAFVAAGEASLDHPVRWVHAGEIRDIARFLSGGEFLLTAGQGVGSTPADQRAYVASLAEAGVAALAIELEGRVFTELPNAVIKEADKRQLPLIGLRREIPFVEASAQVLEQLTDHTLQEFARAAEVNRFLTEQLLSGADHITLVRELARHIGAAVVLESAGHEVRAYYGETEQSRDLLTDWAAHARCQQIHEPAWRGADACRRLPIVVQGSTWGWLHTPAAALDNHLDQIALEQGASAIAISLLNERVSGARSAHHQGILINRLMLGDLSGPGFVDRALRIGKDLRGSRYIVALTSSSKATPTDLEREIGAAFARQHITAVNADIGEALLSVIGLRAERSLGLVVKTLSDPTRTIGLSKIVDADALPAAIRQARAALSAHQPCQFFDKLGILRLLVPLSTGPELAAFVEDELGALLTYDSARDNTLLPTLEALLKHDNNKTEAASILYIQRRTLYYRIERIEQILGVSLDDHDTRLRLSVALRAHKALK